MYTPDTKYTAEQYKLFVEKCRDWANASKSPEVRGVYNELAERWVREAAQASEAAHKIDVLPAA